MHVQLLQPSGDLQTERYHLVCQVLRYCTLPRQPASESAKVTQFKQQDGNYKIKWTLLSNVSRLFV